MTGPRNDPARWGVGEQQVSLHYFEKDPGRRPGYKPGSVCGNTWSDTEPPTMVAGLRVCGTCRRFRGGGPPGYVD